MIFGITGTNGAGKGSIVSILKANGFRHYPTSALLRAILESQGKEAKRETYSVMGDILREIHPAGPIRIQYALAKDEPGDVVIESIHDVPEAEFLRSKGAVILGIDAPLEVRYQRITSRKSEKDNVTFAEFQKLAIHEEEGGGKHNIRKVLEMADYVIQNDGSFGALQAEVNTFLEQYRT